MSRAHKQAVAHGVRIKSASFFEALDAMREVQYQLRHAQFELRKLLPEFRPERIREPFDSAILEIRA
jgi:hypothetical protein